MKDTFVDKYSTAPATRRTLNALLTENAILRLKGVELLKLVIDPVGAAGSLHDKIQEITYIPRGGMVPHQEGEADLLKVDQAFTSISPSLVSHMGAVAFSLNQITEILGMGKLSGIPMAHGDVDAPIIPGGSEYDPSAEYATVQDFHEFLKLATSQNSTIIWQFNRAADRLGVKRIIDRGIGIASRDLVLQNVSDFAPTPRPFGSDTLTTKPAAGILARLQTNIVYIALCVNDMIDFINSISVDPEKVTSLPEFTSTPVISGTPKVGGRLIVSEEDVRGMVTGEPAPRLSIRWSRDGQPLGEETNWSYEVKEQDIGKKISATVYAENVAGKVEKDAVAVDIEIPVPVIVSAPVINGVASVGSVINVSDGEWSGIVGIPSYEYRWREEGAAIDLSTAAELTLTEGLAGSKVIAEVRVSVEGGEWSAWAATEPSVPVGQKPFVKTLGVALVDGAMAAGALINVTSEPEFGGFPVPTDKQYAWSVGGLVGTFGALAPYTIKEGDDGVSVHLVARVNNSTGSFEGVASNSVAIQIPAEGGGGDGTEE